MKRLGIAACVGTMLAIGSGAGPASAATTVNLGTAATYSVLGGQAVTNTGPSLLDADLGVSPGSAVTGFPPGTVGGANHITDASAAQAKLDLDTAYDAAAAQAPYGPVAGDLVGQTLNTGVYNSAGPLSLTGTVTFDGGGDPDSVFVVQVASAFVTGSNSRVATVNGAQACHVFWQVGSSATLGAGTAFQGTILASASITLQTGATVKGRTLARAGSVTLDNNVFTAPSCADDPPQPVKTPTVTVVAGSTGSDGTVTLTATVSSAEGIPTGTVTFTRDGKAIGTVAVDADGHATLAAAAGGVFAGHYNGAVDFDSSESVPAVVTPAPVVVTTPAPTAVTSAAVTPPPTPTVPAATSTVPAATPTVPAATPTVSAATLTVPAAPAVARSAASVSAVTAVSELAATGSGPVGRLAVVGTGVLLAGFGCLVGARHLRVRRH